MEEEEKRAEETRREGRSEEGHEEQKNKVRRERITRERRVCVMVKREDRLFSPPTCPSLTHTRTQTQKLSIFLRLIYCDLLSHNSTSLSLFLSPVPPISVANHLIMLLALSFPSSLPFSPSEKIILPHVGLFSLGCVEPEPALLSL